VIRAGVVWINDSQIAPVQAPWGGFKQSGIGGELGPRALEDYVEAKRIYLNHA
jgi:acyl-CoA reductase-like NAD-dependent aldehyde dehydrogenase